MKQILQFDLSPQDIKFKNILDKQFLELEIYAISNIYPNRNQTAFTEESMTVSKDTCYNKPILGYFNTLLGDFEEHNTDIKFDKDLQQDYYDYTSSKTEKILGVIRESDKVDIVERDNQKWLKITCALWTMYTYRQVKKLLQSKTKKISVEVLVSESHIDKNDILVIDRFVLTGITILGDKITEGIPNAHLNVLDLIQQKDFSSQVKCLSFAYNEDIQLDKMSSLYTNNLQTEGTRVTYKEKMDLLNNCLSEVYPKEDERLCYWICDFSDEFVIIRDYNTEKYFKIFYTIDTEDPKKVIFDLENKVEQIQTFKDFAEKTLEFNGEQKTIEDFCQMYSDLSRQYSQLEETYNTYKDEMSQKAFTVTIDEVEYNINQLQEKMSADLAEKEKTVESLNEELSITKTNLDTMTSNFNSATEDLNTLKQQIKNAEQKRICEEGLKIISSEEDMEDEDKDVITEKCKNNQYSSIEDIEDDIAKAVYKAHKAKRQVNSFQSNIVHQSTNNNAEKKDVFDRLNDYINN